MRIFVASGIFHPESGGPATYLYHLLPALIERGHDVSVLTYGEPNEANASSYLYPIIRITRRRPIPLRLLAFTWEVIRQARLADIVFVSDYGFPVAVANLLLRKPIVLKIVSDFAWEFASRHGWTDHSVGDFQAGLHKIRTRLLRSLQRWYTCQADAIIVPSQHMRKLVQGWGIPDSKINLISNALPKIPQNLPSRIEIRRQLGWQSDQLVLATVGRLAEVKRIDLQLHALQAIPAARLIIVGDGPERGRLEVLRDQLSFANRVKFLGALPHEEALRIIRAADIFLLSSRTEGLSHVLLEAMSLGTPCIATSVGGNIELITDGLNGLLVPFGDISVLQKAICELIESPERRAQIVQAAYTSLDGLSWEHLVDQTEALLKEVAGV